MCPTLLLGGGKRRAQHPSTLAAGVAQGSCWQKWWRTRKAQATKRNGWCPLLGWALPFPPPFCISHPGQLPWPEAPFHQAPLCCTNYKASTVSLKLPRPLKRTNRIFPSMRMSLPLPTPALSSPKGLGSAPACRAPPRALPEAQEAAGAKRFRCKRSRADREARN